jgi:hypothetical protein
MEEVKFGGRMSLHPDRLSSMSLPAHPRRQRPLRAFLIPVFTHSLSPGEHKANMLSCPDG